MSDGVHRDPPPGDPAMASVSPPSGERVTVRDLFVDIGENLYHMFMLRFRGGDPTDELDAYLEWTRSIVLGTCTMGVSVMDAALIMSGDLDREDHQTANDIKYRWTKVERSFFEHLPESIGTDPRHSQVKLYRPETILALIEKVDGVDVCRNAQLAQRLQDAARLARPKFFRAD